ncbi:MAG: hypothetical protein WCO25_05230 [Candidatus Uhrbacteria bacterium]
MPHVRRSVKIQMEWTCTSCPTINKGIDLNCVTCGNPREKKEKKEAYRLPENLEAAEVTDAATRAVFDAGPNWSCESCGSDQRKPNGSCGNCGAGNPTKLASQAPITEHHESIGHDPFPASFEPEFKPPSNAASLVLVGGIATGLIGCAALLFFLLWPRDVVARVESIAWSHTATLRQRLVNNGEGWQRSAPSDAYDAACERRKNGTENCRPHDCNGKMEFETCYDQCPRSGTENCNEHECNCHVDRSSCKEDGAGGADCDEVCDECYDQCPRTGTEDCNPHDCNGKMVYETCYDQCDVFENWCKYRYDTWPVVTTKTTSGTTHETFWPELTATGNDQRLERSEKYEVRFSDEVDRWTYKPDGLQAFARFDPGTSWSATVTVGGGISPVAPVQTTVQAR